MNAFGNMLIPYIEREHFYFQKNITLMIFANGNFSIVTKDLYGPIILPNDFVSRRFNGVAHRHILTYKLGGTSVT